MSKFKVTRLGKPSRRDGARLLVTMAGIPYTYTPPCYLRPLPAWVDTTTYVF